MFEQLSPEQRLLLLKFVCAFAWVDGEVKAGERQFVQRLMQRMQLNAADRDEVEGWLRVEPPREQVQPELVPHEHRRSFIEAVRALIYADGGVDAEERESFERLRAALSAE